MKRALFAFCRKYSITRWGNRGCPLVSVHHLALYFSRHTEGSHSWHSLFLQVYRRWALAGGHISTDSKSRGLCVNARRKLGKDSALRAVEESSVSSIFWFTRRPGRAGAAAGFSSFWILIWLPFVGWSQPWFLKTTQPNHLHSSGRFMCLLFVCFFAIKWACVTA